MKSYTGQWKKLLLVLISSEYFGKSYGATVESKMASVLAGAATKLFDSLREEQKSESFPETRGGWGHGGGHGHGAITLDPVSIISLLALGAFLINNILQLLRTNTGNGNAAAPAGGGGRSLPSSLDMENISLKLSSLGNLNHSEPSFIEFFENVGSLYYLQPKKRHMCMKRVVCNYINMKESRESTSSNFKSKIFDFMLTTVTKIVAPEMDDLDKDDKCGKTEKFCSDSLLKDARVSIEYKIYSQVSSWITKLAFNGISSG